ncbi:MAG: hypothetical protein A2655_02035 [Candidatus Yanofskybacteria bacterium RIFCSPHIGHO2_01_FULL_43_42]|uniref:ABC transporter ATP-binding protein n=1 Tax=Candidatus Yanofskybacteria bacterium RIFCSPLOWO2_01_FULL_43_22 TaxID=1802695 RepID=A0A1F8GGZ5_9BACT|nr:MAG: hypothetical protein A2655_02035 [Candidatus Yanofskybacteria bacterium RIFCSPHIGHO2_01_FULL_43_42]OGN13249.1 MAG: hypothetical protein A3D48_02940 [Candidatus Yanofskybacteria bacterium RIFCSPHIGHO2_02_FULL_43_17]OGN24664.1 MAG: hypothetical protein A3A13_01165 [Candidatus Yanofskybacteria bacterium RIFCSPLOWO2_01_FULL_43_22]
MILNYSKIKFSLRVINKVFRGYKKRLLLILVLGLLAGFSGSIGISVIIPLFSLLADKGIAEPNILTDLMERFFSFFHISFSLPVIVSLMAFLFVFKAVIQFFAKYINDKTGAEYEEKIRTSLFRKTLSANWPYLLNQKSGYLERVVLHDVTQGSILITLSTNFVLFITSFLTYALVAFNISPIITLLTIAFGAVLFLAAKPIFSKAKKRGWQMANFEKDVSHKISQSLIGAKMIKAEGVEDQVVRESRIFFKKLRRLRVQIAVYKHIMGLAFEPVGFLFIAGLFVFYHNSVGFNLISFAAVVYLVQKMFAFIQSAQNNVHQINEITPYVETVLEYRKETMRNEEKSVGFLSPDFKKELIFNNVKFFYEKNIPVLSDINFSVKKGQMVGIIGSSGSGKTTLVDVLLGLLKPSGGDIILDGRSISEFDVKKWRQMFSYVSQDVFLINDTIKNNIRFYNGNLSEKDIIEASKMAQIYDFIKKLPDGLDTVTGERGLKISGGQRQRIALARALAGKPDILILDEATSSLDIESETLIQKAIDGLKGKITVLAVAHRLSTIMNSDVLIILENGKVLEKGSPKELLENKGSHFYKMYNIK